MNIGFDNAFAFITVFGLLVFLHELGHFVIAKWCGIRVEVFSLGFGPRILGWRHQDTDYRVSLIPLGGYVKMLGEGDEMDLVADPRDAAARRDDAADTAGSAPETPPAPAGLPPLPDDSFAAKPRWQRFLVMVAGATMNLILAVLIVTGMNMAGRQEPAFVKDAPRIAGVAEGSPAEKAGFLPGDRVLSMGDRTVDNWETLQQQILFNPQQTLPVTVERQGEVVDLTVDVTLPPEGTRQRRYRIGYIGLTQPAYDVQVWRVEPDSPAAQAGLQEGDLIRIIEGEKILTREAVARIIETRPEMETRLTIERDGTPMEIVATPGIGEEGKGLLGISPGPTLRTRELAFGEAMRESVRQNWERAGLFFRVVGQLITGRLSVRAVSGPVDIFIFSGEALRRGWFDYFDLMALFSLQLGILNLLPIPFLDGGHIAILGIEGVLRRDLSLRLKERLLQVGFVALLLFMGLVLYSDIAKNFDLFTGLFKGSSGTP